MTLEPSSLDDIRQEIAKIASLYGVFQCVECSQAIKEFLTVRQRSEERRVGKEC